MGFHNKHSREEPPGIRRNFVTDQNEILGNHKRIRHCHDNSGAQVRFYGRFDKDLKKARNRINKSGQQRRAVPSHMGKYLAHRGKA